MFDIRKFGAYISKLRKESDMTQSMLADKLCLTRQTVSSYETGDSFPDISILVMISKEFGITIDDLIKSGEPTATEEILLKADVKKSDIPSEIFKNPNISEELMNVAPLLKPSILEKVAEGFKKHDLDISSLLNLAEYMKDDTFVEVLENADFNVLDRNILEKFMPFLDDISKNNLLEKIIDGELDYHFLEIYLPYVDPYYINSQIEAAVLAGTVEWDALNIMKEVWRKKWEKEKWEKIAEDLKGAEADWAEIRETNLNDIAIIYGEVLMNNQGNQDNPKKESSVVALKYEKGYKAPKVIAKGTGYVADKILEAAEENDVFVHTDENLAENLNKLELGSDVPPELFEIVAQIYIFADKIDSIIGEDKAKYIKNAQKR